MPIQIQINRMLGRRLERSSRPTAAKCSTRSRDVRETENGTGERGQGPALPCSHPRSPDTRVTWSAARDRPRIGTAGALPLLAPEGGPARFPPDKPTPTPSPSGVTTPLRSPESQTTPPPFRCHFADPSSRIDSPSPIRMFEASSSEETVPRRSRPQRTRCPPRSGAVPWTLDLGLCLAQYFCTPDPGHLERGPHVVFGFGKKRRL